MKRNGIVNLFKICSISATWQANKFKCTLKNVPYEKVFSPKVEKILWDNTESSKNVVKICFLVFSWGKINFNEKLKLFFFFRIRPTIFLLLLTIQKMTCLFCYCDQTCSRRCDRHNWTLAVPGKFLLNYGSTC